MSDVKIKNVKGIVLELESGIVLETHISKECDDESCDCYDEDGSGNCINSTYTFGCVINGFSTKVKNALLDYINKYQDVQLSTIMKEVTMKELKAKLVLAKKKKLKQLNHLLNL